MMEVTLTCEKCGSAIGIYPSLDAELAACSICQHTQAVKFNQEHMDGILRSCPCCERKDFYKQKDFNRKIGVLLFVLASILSIWTYGISLIVLFIFDLILYKKLADVVACYKCNTLFRKIKNIEAIQGFNHEMNDRIIYAGHDFGGNTPTH